MIVSQAQIYESSTNQPHNNTTFSTNATTIPRTLPLPFRRHFRPCFLPSAQTFTMSHRGRPKGGREVTVSKAVSYLLRHGAEKEGLKMNAQGYANVADVVCQATFTAAKPNPN